MRAALDRPPRAWHITAMITATTDRVFKPADPAIPDFDAAELEAKTLDAQLLLPEGCSIYPCTARFYSWAEPESKQWFQLHYPSGGETTLDRAELLERFPLTPP